MQRMAVTQSLDAALPTAAAGPPPGALAWSAPVPGAPGSAGSVAESGSASAPRPGPDRTTWERIAISPDVELHVRRPLDRTTNKRVDQLARIARELFEDH
jgi:hypothetical protein